MNLANVGFQNITMSLRSRSSSSSDDGLTCLIDVVGGSGPAGDASADAKPKEIIDDEKVLQLRNLVQKCRMQDATMEDKIEDKKDNFSEISPWEQVDILKRENCVLLMEREKLHAELGEVKKSSRVEELEKELVESRAMVQRAKVAKEQLRELYKERSQNKKVSGKDATREEFVRMREEYFRYLHVN